MRTFCIAAATSAAHLCAHAVIYGGTAVPRAGDLDAIAASTVQFKSVGGNICSATIVGNRALLTAARCTSVSAKVSALFGGKTYALECRQVAAPGAPAFDVALCISDLEFEGVRPTRVEASRSIEVGESLVIAGYGCTEAGGLDRGNVGRLTSGVTRVVKSSFKLEDAPQDAPFAVASGASPCFGDAGGGAYRESTSPDAPVVVGLLSRGDLAATTYVVPLASVGLAAAIRRASNEKGVVVCGVSDDTSGCYRSTAASRPATADRSLQLSFPGFNGAVNARPVAGQVVKAAGSGEESVAQAFRRVCGVPLASVAGIGTTRLQTAEATKGTTGEVLDLPPCPPSAAVSPPKKEIQPGDTIWTLWKSARESTSVAPPPPGKTEFVDYVKSFNKANPAIAGAPLKPTDIVNVPPPAGTVAPAKAAVVSVSATPEATPILSLSTAEAEADCKSEGAKSTHPYDLPLLLEMLALNRRYDASAPASVVVLVADSGLQGAGEGVFVSQTLAKPLAEDPVEFRQRIVPTVVQPGASKHGTAVASVALGGPVFARMGVAQGSSHIQLAVQRIYYTPPGGADSPDGVTADVGRFDELIRQAEDQDSASPIVNLSLRSTVPITPILGSLGNSYARILFVAAAGNQSKKLSPDFAQDTEATYPALYGGSARDRMVTVMALRADNTRPPFSNWGERYVDIAAPGCNVPILEWSADVGRFVDATASGTSLAAPLVTFAAALVRSESGGKMAPRDVKRRLLVSADLILDKTLQSEVADGRRLNIPKAAALYSDVVERTDGKVLAGDLKFVAGQSALRDDDILQFKCDRDSDLRVKRRDLFKIAKWMPADGLAKYRVYFRLNSNELFSSDLCQVPSGVSLELRNLNGDGKKVEWSDVKDLVMRF